MKKSNWNSKGRGGDQVNFLLGEIERLKTEHQICGASVIAHWSMRRIQPLQQQVNLGFQYTGEADPSRYTRTKIFEEKVNMVPPAPLGIPIRLLHRGAGVRRGREEERFLI